MEESLGRTKKEGSNVAAARRAGTYKVTDQSSTVEPLKQVIHPLVVSRPSPSPLYIFFGFFSSVVQHTVVEIVSVLTF